MKRNRIHTWSLLMFILLGIMFAPLSMYSLKKEETKQNFLLITIDTLRADRLSCYGSQYPKTPNIDNLAERSMLFSRAFANTSTTLPSHANMLLGTTPNHHGVHENLNFIVSEELLTLAEHLRNNGYSTGAFVGAYPLDSRFGLSQGFDLYDDKYSRVHSVNLSSLERNAEAVIEAALDWLKGRISPWFLWVHCWDPHTPYDPPEPFKSQYRDHLYEGEVAYVDWVMGKLFDHMKENKLFDSTLIIFTGDHGESLGQHGEETHGFFAYNSSIWIPLIISLPEKASGRIDDYVSHVDIFPTVCDVLGINMPPFLQGISLLPALKGKKLPERPIYFESLYPYYSRGWAPLKGFMLQKKKFVDSPIPELYDLNHDFDELNNLAERKKTAQFTSQLKEIIAALTPSEKIDAAQKVDRKTREKLASLGYVSSVRVSKKKDFSVKDDVKVLVPYINKIDEGWNLYKEGKQDAGIKLLKEIIEERKDIDLAYKRLASIYQEMGNKEDALAVLEQGLDALPSSYEIFIEYMKGLISAQQYDKVIGSFEKMNMRETEYDPEIWDNLGTAYAKKGNFDKAIKSFEMGLSLDNKHPELYNNLANACYSHGLQSRDSFVYSRCFEYYKKAIELDPEYPAPYYGLGHAYRQQGDLGGAIYCWEKALEANPDFSQAHFDLAIAYLNTGNKTKAFDLLSEYKKRYYNLMAPAEREKLDALIEQCQK
ncbi:MAG: sulfatase-like hydrolase/transferase [Candidatus Aminicenantes bacterium]|nr:MAG: sulfatase-like hydrolase/transferase [Candidatus Aminicenantes bacterium]